MLRVLPPPPAALADPASLFIDFDGTLVELIDRPDQVVVDSALRSLLGRLASVFTGRVTIISGRSIAQLRKFLGDGVAGLALVGSHGAEWHVPGWSPVTPETPKALDAVEAAFRIFADRNPGTIVESKSYGVTLHYRLAPQLEPLAGRLAEEVARLHGFGVQLGKMMVEVKGLQADKGEAIRTLMAQSPMAGTHPWFLGDDLTDEAGFVAVDALGGAGIFVGAPRPTSARFGLADVDAVHHWLTDIVAAG